MSEGRNFAAAGMSSFQEGLGMLSRGLKREQQKDSIETGHKEGGLSLGALDPRSDERMARHYRALAMRLIAMASNVLIISAPCAVSADPIVSAIAAYRAGSAALEAMPESEYALYGGEDAVAELMLFRPQRVLYGWDRPARTRDGAIEALKYAQVEIAEFGESPAANAMIRAALGYLEAH